jgi:hypothetical protein
MTESPTPDVPVTQADEKLADDVIDEITNRKGLRHEFDNIDPDTQDEIRQAFAEIAARHRLATASEPTRDVPTAPAESERVDYATAYENAKLAVQNLFDLCDNECTMFGSYGEMEVPAIWNHRYEHAKAVRNALSETVSQGSDGDG